MDPISGDKILDSLFDGVYFVDTQRRITYWNAAAERISGYSREEVLGSSCADNMLRHVDGGGCEMCDSSCPIAGTMKDGQARETPIFLHHRLGHRVPVSVRTTAVYDDQGVLAGAVEIFSDNSSSLQIMQEYEQLKQDAFMDPLTGIGNRRYGEMTLSTRMFDLQTHGIPFGLLFLDIDRFKLFNDSYGHKTGDDVLVMVAKTIALALRKIDVVARWGGEEFVVILPGANRVVIMSVAERIRMLIEKSFIMVGADRLTVTVSLGATLSEPDDSVKTVVSRADRHMYRSKEEGRNRVTGDE
jgi:diguanylate cyclase (GGDEF)-like protein/PAS domain S-box-containing protein